MKRWSLSFCLCLAILVSIFITLDITPVHAQAGPVNFDGFDPHSAPLDTELQLDLRGSGFEMIQDMQIFIDGVAVNGWNIESNEVIRVDVYIPPDTPPGAKRVEINYVVDDTPFQYVMDDGFEVLPPEAAPVDGSMQLFSVDPSVGTPGTVMDIYLNGEGFTPAEDYDVIIAGVDVIGRDIESNGVIHAHIFIPDDAAPGPRRVEAVVIRDGIPISAALDEGFRVSAPVVAPTIPPNPPNSQSWLIWLLITVLLSGASFTVGRMLNLRAKLSWKQTAKLQWQLQAQNRLPNAKKVCEWACQKSAKIERGRWEVTRIELTPLPVKGKTPPKRYVEGKALDPLNDLINNGGASLEKIHSHLSDLVSDMMAQIGTWEQVGRSPASIRLDAKLGGAINAEFKLYYAHQTKKGVEWGDELLKWEHNINQPGGEYLGVVRGPTAGEPDFDARARNDLEDCLQDLVKSVRLRV